MTVLLNRSLNGKLYGVTLSVTITPPSQVAGLAAGSITSSTIAVTYAPASGTAPVSYAGYTAIHGSGNWTLNAGSFGATGGTFSGLSAGTSYDLRIVASNSAGLSNTDLTVGISTTAAPTAPSQVGSLTAGTSTPGTIPVTYTAATGTAPITYTGFTSPHNANTWTQNGGSFSSNGGVFTGLSPSTSYDLRIVATNSLGSSTTNLLIGVSTSAPGNGGLIVYISEDPYQGDAQYTIALDGIQQGGTRTATAVHSSGGAEPVSLASSLSPGAHSVTVTFLNDSYGGTPTTDRNLWVNSATYNGTVIRFSSSLLGSTGSALQISFTIGSDGALTADTTEGYVEPTLAVSNAVNRYDIVPSASVVASGASVTVSLYPNGAWNGETLTPAAAVGNGTFSPAAVSTSNGSSSPATFTYTPSTAGEHYISCTNNGSLYNPYSAPLNVFSSSSGTSRTIAASIASGLDQQPHQFDTLTGVASGLSFSGAKGWGEVWINLSSISGATGGLFIKLYDALSSGATTTVGTGTALHGAPVQVAGAVSASGTKRLLLPASNYIYFADIATDAAFTAPVRVPQRFCVGLGIGAIGRSQESGIVQWWNDVSATGETYAKTVVRYSNDYRYSANGGWYRQNGGSGDPSGADSQSAGPQVAGRLIEATMGVVVFIFGVESGLGGGIDQYIASDGSLSSAFTSTIAASGTNNKFRWLWAASLAGWDGSDGQNYHKVQSRFTAATNWVARTYPACAVQGWGAGCTGRPEAAGSGPLGPARLQQTFLQRIEPINPMVVSKDNHAWAAFKYDHANNSSKRLYVQTGIRQILSAELSIFGGLQTKNRGPTLSPAGTIANGSRIIRLPYKLNGGTALQTVTVTQVNPNYTIALGSATANNLASLVSVYPRGGYAGKAQAISITGVAINPSNPPSGYDGTLDVTLAGSTGILYADGTSASFPASGFSVHYAADLQASGGNGYVINNTTIEPPPASYFSMITDNQVGGPWEFGRHIRPKCDIQISVV